MKPITRRVHQNAIERVDRFIEKENLKELNNDLKTKTNETTN